MSGDGPEQDMVLVSACLAGEACRYDGTAAPHPVVLRLLQEGRALPVCPEVLGGLKTPRDAVELVAGRAMSCAGRDVTEEFELGSRLGLEAARRHGCRRAILKARSPSCGCGQVYDGSFSGRLVPGEGLFAAALLRNGILVRTETDLEGDIDL